MRTTTTAIGTRRDDRLDPAPPPSAPRPRLAPALVATLVLAAGLAPLAAVDFVVDTTVDAVDDSPGDGVCATADGACTLRAAIQEANALAGADTVTVPAGVFKLKVTGSGEDAAATGDLDITDDLVITGAGQHATFVDGTPSDTGAADRVFDVAPGAESIAVTISDLTVQRGGGNLFGGGIRNHATLLVQDATLRWNGVSGTGRGGGLYSFTSSTSFGVTLERVRVEDNTGTTQGGGGVFIDSGKAVIIDSSIGWNSAGRGGGLYATSAFEDSISDPIALTVTGTTFNHNRATGTGANGGGIGLTGTSLSGSIVSSTVYGNLTSGDGGGVHSTSTVALNNVTIAKNHANGAGGGLDAGAYSDAGNSLLADNTAGTSGPDCKRINGTGYNLIEDVTGCTRTGSTTGDVTGTDPGVAPLAFYGGPTRAAPPLGASVAIDAGNPAAPTGSGGTCATTDQAGVARPIGVACDIGAWEADGTETYPSPATADFIVTSFDDFDGWPSGANDTNLGDGVCLTADGFCTLRAAIEEANSLGGVKVIELPPGVYDDRQSVTGDNAARYGDFDIVSGADITLRGAGAQDTIINGRIAGEPVFHVLSGGSLTLLGVMVRKGAGNDGGGILNQGTLDLQSSVLRDNFGNNGSGVYNQGDVTVQSSVIRDNRATQSGGGLYGTFDIEVDIFDSAFIDNVAATLGDGGGLYLGGSNTVIERTTIDGNRAERGGGLRFTFANDPLHIVDSTISNNVAFYISTISYGGGLTLGGSTVLENVTISGNDAKTYGGGIYSTSDLDLTNVTIADNVAPEDAGILFTGTTTVVNTIVADNSSEQCSDYATLTSNGHNLSSDATCVFDDPDDQESTDPLLGPLADNGGPTWTQALLAGSPAIDAGDDVAAPAADQRGVSRPQGTASDIGAFEGEPDASADLGITKTDDTTEAVPGTTITYTITVTNHGPDDVTGAVVTDTLDGSKLIVSTASWTCLPSGGAGPSTACPASGDGDDLALGVEVDLEAGDSVVFELDVTILSAATGDLVNEASVAHPTIPDDDDTNDTSTDTDTLTPQADLTISKSNGVDGFTAGAETTYQIVVGNTGPSDAPGATVEDVIPAGLESCSWTCVAGGDADCPAPSGPGGLDDTVNLPFNGTVTFSLTCTVAAEAEGEISNTATVTAPGSVAELDTANDTATDTDTVLGGCGFPDDLTVSDTLIDGEVTYQACQTLTLGPGLEIVSPADVTLRAGVRVSFGNGVALGSGAKVAIEIDDTLSSAAKRPGNAWKPDR